MTAPEFWAVVALLAFAGWATTLVFFGKSVLPVTNAMNALVKLNDYEDRKIAAVLERLRQRRDAAVPQSPHPQPMSQQRNPLDEIFGGPVLEPIDEQPELETVEL